MLNKIVNSRNFNWKSEELDKAFNNNWLYVGRGKGDLQGSILGNPHRAWKGNAVEKFRVSLWELMEAGDEGVLNELAKIKPTTVLVCHCNVPSKCHSFVIAKAARWLRNGGFGHGQ